jgi:hypothetical protein
LQFQILFQQLQVWGRQGRASKSFDFRQASFRLTLKQISTIICKSSDKSLQINGRILENQCAVGVMNQLILLSFESTFCPRLNFGVKPDIAALTEIPGLTKS